MKGFHHTTPEQEAEILRLYEEKQSTRLVADALGLPLQRVSAALKRQGATPNRYRPTACDRHKETVLRMVAEEASLSEIGRVVGTNNKRVREWLVKNSIPYVQHDNKGSRNGRWKGGRRIDKDGYILLWMPEHPNSDRHGLVREHRYVMEQQLDRLLLPDEVVHHIDGNPQNNSPDNLEVFDSNGNHLALTLKGKVPNFSAEGMERMKERGRRLADERRSATRQASEPDASL